MMGSECLLERDLLHDDNDLAHYLRRETCDAETVPITAETERGDAFPAFMALLCETPQRLLEVEFGTLASVWRKETGLLSSVRSRSLNWAYQRIIGMGEPVVPLILQELCKEPDDWFWALTAITGENPILDEQAGDMEAMAKAWIEWGKRQGCLNGSMQN